MGRWQLDSEDRVVSSLSSGKGDLVNKDVITITVQYYCNCNCNYILFTKLPWPGDSEGTFWSLSQAATCPPVYHTRRRLHTVPFNGER